MKFLIRGMREIGELAIKMRSLNKQSGSVLDEWGRLGYESKLNREDVKYLQAISVPRIENWCRITVGTMPQMRELVRATEEILKGV